MKYSLEQQKLLSLVSDLESKNEASLYLVGGLVRDLFLGHDIEDKDIDFLVAGSAAAFASEVVALSGGKLEKYSKFLTAKIINPEIFTTIKEIDFASAREEIYETPGALPTVSQSTLADDLRRRDFTVNAIALPVSEAHKTRAELVEVAIDPFHGRADLERGLIRVLHKDSFRDDPTRLYRACRYLARMDGALEQETKELFGHAIAGNYLETISAFRQFRELEKIFQEPLAGKILDWMVTLELYAQTDLLLTVDAKVFRDEASLLGEEQITPESLFGLLYKCSADRDELTAAFRRANVSKKRIEGYESLLLR